MADPAEVFQQVIESHLDAVQSLNGTWPAIARCAAVWNDALGAGKKILFCGNGGSAADAQHLAAELVGRFQKERAALPALALHTDTSALTAIANDFGFDAVYERQVEAHGRQGDVLMAISTSGNSESVLRAASRARQMGLTVVAMTGRDGGKLKALADVWIGAPSDVTARIQECHILIGHFLCEVAEQ